MALTPQQQVNVIRRAATRHGIAPSVLWGLYGAETNFGKNVRTSGAGAVGPFQFEPGTARSLGINPNNFRQAANGAAKYLSTYRSRGVKGMLAAYNAGPAGDPNNAETRAYVPRVLQLAKTFPGGGRVSSSGGGGVQTLLSGGGGGDTSVPQGSEGALALIQALTAKPAQPQSAGLQAPAVSAAPVMPRGAQMVQSGGGPVAKPDAAALLSAIRTVGGDVPGGASGGQGATLTGSAGSGGGAGPTRGSVPIRAGGGYAGTQGLAQAAAEIGSHYGLRVTSGKRQTETTATGGVSDHYVGKKDAFAYDLGDGQLENAAKLRAAKRIAHRFGVPFVKDTYNRGTVRIGGHDYRVQVLYGAGVDHADHVHVGIERV